MSASLITGPSVDPVLAELIEQITDQFHAGQPLDLDACIKQHPERAEELRRLWPALQMLAVTGTSAGEREHIDGAGEALSGILGDFRIVREIGRGGMGVVYEAEQISLSRRVALKMLPFASTLDSKQLQRFKNEAQAAAGLHHTNIVPVYATGCERGVHYYAMQLIEGQTLAALIRDQRRREGRGNREPRIEDRAPKNREGSKMEDGGSRRNFDSAPTGSYAPVASGNEMHKQDAKEPTVEDQCSQKDTMPEQPRSSILDPPSSFFRTVANLGIQAAEALEHAHSMGIIHRDVKPANLMVDARGNLWIADFGLAHCQGACELTMTGDFLGTLRYMSPEQALAQRILVDQRTDIYSLGVTLYELLTLEPAFPASDRRELLRQIAFDEPRSPRRLNKAIPTELETIVLKAIEKNPADRYGTAQELADDLERFLKEEPIRARRPSWRQHARKWIRRHPGVTGTAAVSAVVILLLLVAGLWANNRMIRAEQEQTRQEKDRAEREKETAQAREAETKAVLDFVENKVFAAARPKNKEGGQGYDVKLADAVKAALPFVDKSFTGQPLIEARLRMTMGISFAYLGDAKTAIGQFQAARELYTEHSPEHPDTLRSMLALADSYEDAGRTQEALKLFEETLQLMKAKLGPDHPDTLFSMSGLASSYRADGRTQEALKLFEETLQLRKAKLGPDHLHTLYSMDHLAGSYDDAGRTQEALKLYEETLQLMKANVGSDHPDTVLSMNNLARSYRTAGRTQEAIKLFEETLPLMKAKLGPDNPNTLKCMANLANSYIDAGRTQEALKLYEETLQLRKAKLGPDHPDTLWSLGNLASSYLAAGRTEEALELHKETLQLTKAKLGPDHPATLQEHGQSGQFLQRRWPDPGGARAPQRNVPTHESQARCRPPRHAPEHEQPGWLLQRRRPHPGGAQAL